MRKKNKIILIITIVIILCFIVLPQAAIILLALCVVFYAVNHNKKIKQIILWKNIFQSVCSKITGSASEFTFKRTADTILGNICELPNIKAAWIMRKDDDGVFRVYAARNETIVEDIADYNMTFRNIFDYIGAKEAKFNSPQISENILKSANTGNRRNIRRGRIYFLHLPIKEGKRLNGVLTIASNKKKYFIKYGVGNFQIISNVVQNIFSNISQVRYVENMSRKVQNEVEVTADELNKTNIRLVHKVKELRLLYNLSHQIFTSESSAQAAEFVFETIKETIKTKESLFFNISDNKFISLFTSYPQNECNIELPFSFLPQNKPMIINDVSEVKELAVHFHKLKLKQILVVPARVGDKVKGLIISGTEELREFSYRDMELLTLYASWLAEYIEKNNLIIRIVDDNIELKGLNEVKDKFISLISHELRTPLTSIKGFSEMLLNEEAGTINTEQRDFITTIISSVKKLRDMITNIIELSDYQRKQIKLNKEEVSWNDLIKKVFDNFKNDFKIKNIKISLKVDKNIDKVNVDIPKIKKALTQLLSNALKFTKNGGKVDLISKKRSGFIETIIKDTGIGISKEMNTKIFKTFVQAEDPITREIGGIGIGLALTKRIIESHDGRIHINSTPAMGTEVSFMLPIKRKGERGKGRG